MMKFFRGYHHGYEVVAYILVTTINGPMEYDLTVYGRDHRGDQYVLKHGLYKTIKGAEIALKRAFPETEWVEQ